jgi:hypothetical protein
MKVPMNSVHEQCHKLKNRHHFDHEYLSERRACHKDDVPVRNPPQFHHHQNRVASTKHNRKSSMTVTTHRRVSRAVTRVTIRKNLCRSVNISFSLSFIFVLVQKAVELITSAKFVHEISYHVTRERGRDRSRKRAHLDANSRHFQTIVHVLFLSLSTEGIVNRLLIGNIDERNLIIVFTLYPIKK